MKATASHTSTKILRISASFSLSRRRLLSRSIIPPPAGRQTLLDLLSSLENGFSMLTSTEFHQDEYLPSGTLSCCARRSPHLTPQVFHDPRVPPQRLHDLDFLFHILHHIWCLLFSKGQSLEAVLREFVRPERLIGACEVYMGVSTCGDKDCVKFRAGEAIRKMN